MAFLPKESLRASARGLALPYAKRSRWVNTATQAVLEYLPKRKILMVSGPDAAPLLQSLLSQDVLRFAPLLGASVASALGPSGPLTRLQVKDTRPKSEGTDAFSFPLPPHSFMLHINKSSRSSCRSIHHLLLWRRPAIAAALLNAKGRVLADTFLVWRDSATSSPRFMLDVDATVAERIIAYLKRHAVSSNVAIDFDEALAALQLLPPPITGLALRGQGPLQCMQGLGGPPKAFLSQAFSFSRCSNEVGPSYLKFDGGPCDDSAAAADNTTLAALSREAKSRVLTRGKDGRVEGLIVADPRTWRLGYRVYLDSLWGQHGEQQVPAPALESPHLPPSQAPKPTAVAGAARATFGAAATSAAAETSGAAPASSAAVPAEAQRFSESWYEVYRHVAGVCEGPEEVGIAEQMPLPLNLDLLGLACSHNKGCFVGQEVLTRALHQLSNRRRVVLLLKHGRDARDPCPQGAPEAPPTSAPAEESDETYVSLAQWVPPHVAAEWEGALSAAVNRLVLRVGAGNSEQRSAEKGQKIEAGDRVYKHTPGAKEGEAGGWREVGVVLAHDEVVGGGLCLLRSRPGDGPLKTAEDLTAFAVSLSGPPLRVRREGPPKEPPQAEEGGSDFIAIPPPYSLDILLSAPKGTKPTPDAKREAGVDS